MTHTEVIRVKDAGTECEVNTVMVWSRGLMGKLGFLILYGSARAGHSWHFTALCV